MTDTGRTDGAIDRGGVFWTLIGFGAAGVSGLFLNLIIEYSYDLDVLGVYSTLLAVFLVGGQVGAMGLHSSVLFHTPAARAKGEPTGQVVVTALRTAVLSSLVCVVVVVVGGQILLSALGSDTHRYGLWAIAIGLYLYPVNKVLHAHLNGLRRIRGVAVITALRFVSLVVIVGLLALTDVDSRFLPWSMTITEVLILGLLLFLVRAELSAEGRRLTEPDLVGRQRRFGLRGMTAGLLLDLNTRIDVLALGALAGSTEVGYYVVASVFGEGLYQLAMVARFSYDPLVAGRHVEGRHEELRDTLRAARRRIYLLMVPVAMATVLAYPIVVRILYNRDIADQTWPVYAFLAAGVMVSAGYIPFTSLMQQTGDPATQSVLLTLISGTNLVLNLSLVPFFGATGAAAATAAAQAALVPYLRYLSKKRLGFAP